jgi:hypothetical protein
VIYTCLFSFVSFFLGEIPLKFDHFYKCPPNVQKLSLIPLELSIVLNLDPFVQIRAQIFF